MRHDGQVDIGRNAANGAGRVQQSRRSRHRTIDPSQSCTTGHVGSRVRSGRTFSKMPGRTMPTCGRSLNRFWLLRMRPKVSSKLPRAACGSPAPAGNPAVIFHSARHLLSLSPRSDCFSCLLMSQRDYGIHLRRPPRRNIGREQCGEAHQQGSHRQRGGVCGPHSIEHRREKASQKQRRKHANRHAAYGAVLAPMPRPSVRITSAANPGFRASIRRPCRASPTTSPTSRDPSASRHSSL